MASGDDAELAIRLRGWRERAFLTQEQLAERARLGVRTIRRLESGHPHRPNAGSLRLLASALGLTDDERSVLVSACRTEPSAAAPAALVPRMLPVAVRHFVGRTAELARLSALADEAAGPGAPVVIGAIDGTAGVGKTALAVHWAHLATRRFPDGQLYVNLRGFDPAGTPLTPAGAINGFLHALGVDPAHVPADLDVRAGLYRSLLAGRRMLIVLDNARDVDQVRPLLPGGGPSVVLVTSRSQLPGLAAAECAHLITLDLLTAGEARLLLASRLGPGRVAGQRRATDDLVARCARLPLALAIVAARAEALPTAPLSELATELAGGRSLEVLDAGDRLTEVRAVLSWSHRGLGDEAARLFRLLGLHPGPDVTPPAMASLMALPASRVQPMLEELTRAHLITEHGCGRFSSHDLLRAHAVELAHARETDAGRQEALHRTLDHYLHTGHAATMLLETRPRPGPLSEPRPGVAPEPTADQEQALAWFAAEHAVLLAAVDLADAAGMDGHTWQLAWTLVTFLERQGHWDDWTAVLSTAVGAARRLSDRAIEAWAHRGLSRACARLGRPEEAEAHYRCALELYAALGDRTGLAHTHVNIGLALAQQGRYREAMRHVRRAARHYRAAGDLVSLAVALNNIGWYHAQLGCHDRALASCERALALHRDAGNRSGEAETWDSLGYAHHHLGHHRSAITCYRHAIDLWHAMGDRSYEADALDRLGDTHRAAGDPASAEDAWRRALDILAEAGLPGADRIQVKLAG